MITKTAPKRRDAFFLLWGFVLWLAATAAFHLFGDWLIEAGNGPKNAISFLVAVPVILGCTLPMYALRGIPPSERLRSAVCIALPGMLLDALSLPFHRTVFPVLADDSIPLLAAWLLWAYSLIIASGWRGNR
ncbi:DUF5367 family protein [Paenibacillus flagellatus]|uniref:DUF5367 domain-containing protein n=1 Tax=Paenibacillus flagellatus TaxID=2211139 RepID=A0A2V5KRA0_9BACL|nr:DUF5367 family protein [Paenibacillus flagellatus]PYI51346.1 hypothetical protein DLM86_25305 [Paenibacillus flagellatus]